MAEKLSEIYSNTATVAYQTSIMEIQHSLVAPVEAVLAIRMDPLEEAAIPSPAHAFADLD